MMKTIVIKVRFVRFYFVNRYFQLCTVKKRRVCPSFQYFLTTVNNNSQVIVVKPL